MFYTFLKTRNVRGVFFFFGTICILMFNNRTLVQKVLFFLTLFLVFVLQLLSEHKTFNQNRRVTEQWQVPAGDNGVRPTVQV